MLPLVTLGLLLFAALALTIYFQPAWPARVLRWLNPDVLWFYDVPPGVPPMAALTIDDSPWGDGSSTEALLDVLKENGVTVTWFVISGQIRTPRHRALLRRMVEEGHEIGNHGAAEDRAILLSGDDYDRSLRECDRVLREYQPTIRWHRPGSGLFNARMVSRMATLGYRMVLGNVFPHDPLVRHAWHTSLFLRWRTRPGAIVIIHDRPWTAPALREALPALARRVQLVSVSKMLEGINVIVAAAESDKAPLV